MPEFTEVQKERVKESMDYFRNAFWHHSGEMRRIANFRAIADDPVFDGTKIKALTEMELGELSEAWQEMQFECLFQPVDPPVPVPDPPPDSPTPPSNGNGNGNGETPGTPGTPSPSGGSGPVNGGDQP